MRLLGLSKLKDRYDVIIIGAGIGGLTAGLYLVKSGLSVLIIEHHSIPGGFCTSFRRGEFVFDIGVHYFGNTDSSSVVGKLIRDFSLDQDMTLKRINPSDVVITPGHYVKFSNFFEETIQNIQSSFPSEASSIEKFCRLINSDNFLVIYKRFKNLTFRSVLDEYFIDENLKQLFCVMLGNIGLPSTMVSALTAAVMYRDYVFRGGYYPLGGMQMFPDAMAKKFIAMGGDLLLNKSVEKIEMRNQKAHGVRIAGGAFVSCDNLVSNCGARQTFIDLIGTNHLPVDLVSRVTSLTPSPSSFIVYFSLNGSLKHEKNIYSNTWLCPSGDIDNVYKDCMLGKINTDGFLFCALPSLHDSSLAPAGYESGHLIILVPYMSREYWQENQQRIADKLIIATNKIVPGFSSKIHKIYPATPETIVKYTKADRGAIYGWASTLEQNGATMPSNTFVPNVYLAGHWSTLESGQGGITMVVYSGKSVAKSIITRTTRAELAV